MILVAFHPSALSLEGLARFGIRDPTHEELAEAAKLFYKRRHPATWLYFGHRPSLSNCAMILRVRFWITAAVTITATFTTVTAALTKTISAAEQNVT
jgi:hypothetical protein